VIEGMLTATVEDLAAAWEPSLERLVHGAVA